MEEITIQMEEYKELLIIKGKYEELNKKHRPLIVYDGYKENGTTIIPCGYRTNDSIPETPYKITCKGE